MKARKQLKKQLKLAMGLVITLSLFACSKESPLSPNEEAFSFNKKTTDQLHFLKAKTISLQKVFNVNQVITVTAGGTVEVGDSESGTSRITFKPGDVREDVSVNFWWDSNSFQAEFSPHGITFTDSVLVRLSYKDADLFGVNVDDLGIWYFNEDENLWELTGFYVNKDEKYVEGYTTHFSRYTLAHAE